jgi:hypothetical protein
VTRNSFTPYKRTATPPISMLVGGRSPLASPHGSATSFEGATRHAFAQCSA